MPFEDCLGVGHSSGVSSLIVPDSCMCVWHLITLDADDISKVEQGGREGEGGEEGEEGGAKGRRGSGVRLSKRKAAERESKVLVSDLCGV